MKLEIYTAPLLTALEKSQNKACAFCALKEELNAEALEFTLGPSYMEPDVRDKTNELGFCPEHLAEMLKMKNRLGMALMLQTRLTVLAKSAKNINSCFVCDRVNTSMERYFDTLVYIWKRGKLELRPMLEKAAFCLRHNAELMARADGELKSALTEVHNARMKELSEDVEWFIKKFDYRFADEPWGSARDAVERACGMLGCYNKEN